MSSYRRSLWKDEDEAKSKGTAPSATDLSTCLAFYHARLCFIMLVAFGRLIGRCERAPAPQGYMVLEDGDFVTPIEGWFFMPSLSRYAEKGGVSKQN